MIFLFLKLYLILTHFRPKKKNDSSFAVMKSFLCTRNFQDKNLLKNHYIVEYKSNPNNWFFKAPFGKDKDRFFVSY